MPLNGNTYVAPTWRNGGPPALDAAELQAISDSIVRNQGKNADQDTLIAALQTAVGGKAQIEVGSYVGTGAYGESNPCSITCRFAPKLVMIFGRDYNIAPPFTSGGSPFVDMSTLTTEYVKGRGFYLNSSSANLKDNGYAKKSTDGKTVQWYSSYKSQYPGSDSSYQLNSANVVYRWIAFEQP